MGGSELVTSVEAVSAAALANVAVTKPWPRATDRDDVQQLVESLRAVASAAAAATVAVEQTAEPTFDSTQIVQAIYETVVAVTKHSPLLLPNAPAPSLSRLLGRELDENLHSDFLAALLSSQRVGEFAFAFLDALLASAGIERHCQSSARQFANREMRLDEVDCRLSGTEVGSRRIDVLVRAADCVVAIENKVLTLESENQTADYAAAVLKRYQAGRAVHLIFLSPTGLKAQHSEFRAVSYRQLYESLLAAAQNGPPRDHALPVLQTYLACLASDFVHLEERALRASIARLKEAGYEF